MKKLKSIRSYIIIGVLICLIGGFAVFAMAGFYFFQKITQERAREMANEFSLQTFNSMYQVMKRGWSRADLEEFLNTTKEFYKNSSTKIDIFRSPIVEELYGKIPQQLTPEIKSVFSNGNILTNQDSSKITSIYPIRADKECISCHTNTKPGAILGAIEVVQDTKRVSESTKHDFVYTILVLLFFSTVLVFIISGFILKPIRRTVGELERSISEIESIKELKKIDTINLKSGPKEFDAVIFELKKLIKKLKEVATDRDLLEFKVRLLDKLIITSDVIKDWREYIKGLLIEINTIIKVCYLFVIFKVGEESYDIEIFWINEPSAKTKEVFEEMIYQRVKESPYFNELAHLRIHHRIAKIDKEIRPMELSEEMIDLQTKSLILTTPEIGGIVGMGIHSLLDQDPIRYMVIESILTRLINVIGSIKTTYKYTKELEYYATRDPLTNLYNQRVFREFLEYEIGRAARHDYKFGLLMIDFDNFKMINDKFGHEFGDNLLIKFANEMREVLRSEDIIARYGDDEFVVIAPKADSEQVYLIAQRIRDKVKDMELISPNGKMVRVSVSIGFAIFPDHGKNLEEMFAIADNMVYKTKRSGKDGISIPAEDDIIDSLNRMNQKIDLVLDSIEKGSIVPFFQPIKSLTNNNTEIYELLMRIEKDGEYIAAFEFIETAETLNIIHKMDYVTIDRALAKTKSAGYQGYIFINISPKALIVGGFIPKIKELTKKYDFPCEKLIVEIKEQDSVKNITLLEKFVLNLKMEGFKFAIDDFGSGFWSFRYLKRLPIDYIKIDGKFIQNLTKDRANRAFAKSIVTLAKELNTKTVAKYVENKEVLDEVRKLGIDFAQGYYIGKPSLDGSIT